MAQRRPITHVLVVGDSLSMVRPDAGIRLENLYTYELQRRVDGVHVHNASVRANTSREILSDAYFRDEHVIPSAPDVVIFQVGIVDCTPRIIGDHERRLLHLASQVPVARTAARWLIRHRSARRYDLTRNRPFSLVPLDEYGANVATLLDRVLAVNAGCWFVHVPVPCPTGPMVARNYGIVDIVARYNEAAGRAIAARGGASVPFFDVTRDNPSLLLDDGYHLGLAAHRYLADELGLLISERVRGSSRIPAASSS